MNNHFRRPIRAFLVVLFAGFAALAAQADGGGMGHGNTPYWAGGWQPVQRFPDISGLAWMGGDTFLVVHDAKYPDEINRVRTSLLRLPGSLDGIEWLPLRTHFPGRPSSDLESAARIPGTQRVLLLESGDDASGLDRIYLAEVRPRNIRVVDAIEWSSFTSVFNVEGAAVAESGGGYIFIWAERAEGQSTTEVRWTDLRMDPFAIGASQVQGSALFTLPQYLAELYNRPLVGLEVDSSDRIYAVAAFDPDSDAGPFRSAVMVIGRVENGSVILDPEPTVLSVMDGFKAESVAVRGQGSSRELFVGTDDENYGGTLRQLPIAP